MPAVSRSRNAIVVGAVAAALAGCGNFNGPFDLTGNWGAPPNCYSPGGCRFLSLVQTGNTITGTEQLNSYTFQIAGDCVGVELQLTFARAQPAPYLVAYVGRVLSPSEFVLAQQGQSLSSGTHFFKQ